MQVLRSLLYKIAPVHETVLLTGETGAGKELVADAIISLSTRRDRPAVKLNCAALPRDLIESEIFGVGKRVATEVDERPGKFELAQGGTVVLDEIGELPLDLQAKLLRVIETGEVQRVGVKETLKVDVRVIAATNRDLKAMVQAGGFRRDLYHRLNILPIQVPSLRERPSDIPLLARRFLKQFAKAYGRLPLDISPASLERIEGYPWPGNVRELKNTICRAAVYADGAVVEIDEFLDLSRDPHLEGLAQTLPIEPIFPLRVQERRWILEALARNHGNVAKAARDLEIGEATVRRVRKELTGALASHRGDIDQTAQKLGISHSLIRTVISRAGDSTLS